MRKIGLAAPYSTVTRTDAGRLAAFLAVAMGLLLSPALANGHQLGVPEEAASGRQHTLEHMKVSRAQMRAWRQWQRMTPKERRRARRAQRRARRGAFVGARAAAGDPADLGSWAPPFVMATDYKGYAVHAAMLNTGKVLMWGQQGAPRGTATYAWLWDPAKGYGSDAMRDVTPSDASGNNIPIFCSGMSFLPDGRVLAVGGTLARGNEDPGDEFDDWAGLNAAVVFDPATEQWTELPRPAGSKGRWYPTQVLLGDGRTFVMSGYTDDAPGGVFHTGHEIYSADTNAFTLLETPAQRRAPISTPTCSRCRTERSCWRAPPGRTRRSSTRRTSPPRGPTFRSSPRAASAGTRSCCPRGPTDRPASPRSAGGRSAGRRPPSTRGSTSPARLRPGRASRASPFSAPGRTRSCSQTDRWSRSAARTRLPARPTSAPSSCTTRSPGAGAPARARSRRAPTTPPRCSCRTGGCSPPATTATRRRPTTPARSTRRRISSRVRGR